MSSAPNLNGFDPIPLCVPEIRGNEWTYIKECLDTNWVSSAGKYVDRFESMLAERVDCEGAVATVNGTAAIHTTLLALGIEAGDEVLVSNLTFIAPVNSIRYIGAYPVLMDADPTYWQMDAEKLSRFLKHECERVDGVLQNKATKRPVRAIIVVHILGHPCDMDPIIEIADQYGLHLIEDATESLGAKYKDRAIGSLGAAACFSFNGNKLITTGGGGMISSGDHALLAKAKYLTTQAKDDPIEYIHNEVGYNYRLTNIQAAMGCAQLENIGSYIEKKREVADRYEAELSNIPQITFMPEAEWAYSVKWLYTILVEGGSRELMAYLKEQKIQTRPLWHPIHLNPAYTGFQAYECETSVQLNRDALSIPCSVGLTEADQLRTIQAIQAYFA